MSVPTALRHGRAPLTESESLRAVSRIALCVALLALCWFATLGAYGLYNPDEGRYAEIPREMLLSGDWVTPRLNEIKYFEKPPLQYWTTAAAYRTFGIAEWTARLWPALTGFLGILLTAWLAHRLYGPRTAVLAAAVQAGSLLYAFLGHFATLDMGLCFSLQLAMTGLVWLAASDADVRENRKAALLLAAGVALAFLSKGLVGILIPAAVAGLYMLTSGDWKLLLRSRPWWSIVALLVLAAPWVITVSHRNPEFAQFFFIHEHLARYFTRVHARYHSSAFFVPVVLIGFLPWSAFLPAIAVDVRHAWRSENRPVRMLAIWALFVFLFFSFSQSKLLPYVIPMFPALALLTGRALTAIEPRRAAGALTIAAIFWLAVGSGIALLSNWPPLWDRLHNSVGAAVPELMAGVFVMGALLAVAAVLALRRSVVPATCVAALATMMFASASLISAQRMPKMMLVPDLVEQVRPHWTARTALYCVGDFEESLPYYLSRPCTLVGYRGELDLGLQQEPWRWIPDLAQFAARWREQNDAVAIMRPPVYEELRRMGVPMRIIGAKPALIAVAREGKT